MVSADGRGKSLKKVTTNLRCFYFFYRLKLKFASRPAWSRHSCLPFTWWGGLQPSPEGPPGLQSASRAFYIACPRRTGAQGPLWGGLKSAPQMANLQGRDSARLDKLKHVPQGQRMAKLQRRAEARGPLWRGLKSAPQRVSAGSRLVYDRKENLGASFRSLSAL